MRAPAVPLAGIVRERDDARLRALFMAQSLARHLLDRPLFRQRGRSTKRRSPPSAARSSTRSRT
ncbi:MAG: hypothetical protein ACLT98_08580 [Eggerthellaceae bacterium]